MINFDYLTLKAFVEENIDFLIDSRLQKIQQPILYFLLEAVKVVRRCMLILIRLFSIYALQTNKL